MTFKDFKKLILLDLENALNSAVKIELKEVQKNNGVVLSGLTIQSNETNNSPCIYLNGYYD